VAAMLADGVAAPATYTVDVPGGRLRVTWTESEHVLLSGPAVVVASGFTSL
jgi:diaminopimelate epimerase